MKPSALLPKSSGPLLTATRANTKPSSICALCKSSASRLSSKCRSWIDWSQWYSSNSHCVCSTHSLHHTVEDGALQLSRAIHWEEYCQCFYWLALSKFSYHSSLLSSSETSFEVVAGRGAFYQNGGGSHGAGALPCQTAHSHWSRSPLKELLWTASGYHFVLVLVDYTTLYPEFRYFVPDLNVIAMFSADKQTTAKRKLHQGLTQTDWKLHMWKHRKR